MKKLCKVLITVLLTLIIAACSTPIMKITPPAPVEDGLSPTSTSSSAASVSAIIAFSDPVLEEMVRGSMGKAGGGITLAEAQAVTRIDLNDELQRHLSEELQIRDLSGLESFTNLETLDLSNHAIIDISPLQRLTKLTALSLAENPVGDVSPLSGLTNLKLLILSGSQASDYSALSNLVDLQVLMLDDSTISDLTPLTALTNLRQLYLANTPVEDFSPLEIIYPNLVQKDFVIASTLEELGFQLDYSTHQAYYDSEIASFSINHAIWGAPPAEWDENIIRISMYLEGDYKLSVGYYGVHKAYVCQMYGNDGELMNYVYNISDDSYNLDPADRPRVEEAIRVAFDVLEGEEVLHTPVRIFDELLKNTFNMTPEKLFAMPYAPPTLRNLGFFEDKENAVYLFEDRGEREVNLEVHRPEWGENDFDVRFFTPLSDYYRIVISYHVSEDKFEVGIDDNDMGGAKFVYYSDSGEFVDEWCSDNDKTVEECFIKAYDDSSIEDVYQHSVDLMVNYIRDRFGMSILELYALPTGE